MRRFTLFSSVAAFPLLLASTTAFAQQTDQTDDQDDDQAAVEAETQADGDAGASKNEGQSIITVTGLRQSLESSQAIKRNADAILDAIVAEDIGKLPDDTAAESLARIAGVQVERFSDEANRVLIRGLPDVATSYNGREIFTAELRRVQLQDFPAQALAGIEVYKSGTADIIEPGLAGLVNVRTRRPFDFKNQVLAGGFRGTYNDQSRKTDFGGNVLFSDRWNVGDGEMGLLANVTYAQSSYYNGVRYNSDWIRDSYWSDIDTPGDTVRSHNDGNNGGDGYGFFRFPNNIGLYNDGGKRWRPSGNFAFQWAPNNNSEYYVEGIYQGYRGENFADNFDIPLELWGPDSTPPVFTNVELYPGQSYSDTQFFDNGFPDATTAPQAQSFRKSLGSDPQGYRSTSKGETNTYQIAAGGKWEADRVTLSTDFAYTWSRYTSDAFSLDFFTQGAQTVDTNFNTDGGQAFSFPNWDPSDPSGYFWRGYYNAEYDVSGAGLQWRGDIDLDTEWDFLPKLKFGLRVTSRDANQDKNVSRYTDAVRQLDIPLSDLPLGGPLVLTTDPFRGNAQGFTQYLAPTRNAIFGNREELRQFTVDRLQELVALYPNDPRYARELAQWQSEGVPDDPFQTNLFHAKEDTYAAYLQGKYQFLVGDVEVLGVVGARGVITHGSVTGNSLICTTQPPTEDTCTRELRTEKQDYFDLLPNASMVIKFTPKIQLRFGYTQTRTKPDFGALNPSLDIRPVYYAPCGDPGDPDYDPTGMSCLTPGGYYPDYRGRQGNPNLKPFTSKNYDVSLEYYFSRTGYVSVSAFYRDIFGFTTDIPRRIVDPVYGQLELTGPINAADATIKGAEANFQTFFDFLPEPFNGFGVSANVTYLKGTNSRPIPSSYDAVTQTFADYVDQPIEGLSKWTYNFAAFYEKSGLTARISYNKRDTWLYGYGFDFENGQGYTGRGTAPVSRLDAGVSYDITKNFTLSVDASNILAKPFKNYTAYQAGRQYPIDVRDEGRYFGFGLRFRFGE